MIILLHTSKTMRTQPAGVVQLRRPQLLKKAERLAQYLKTLSSAQLIKVMAISSALAQKTHALLAAWTSESHKQTPAIDSFVGDIYSGLQANTLTSAQRDYADKTLAILSGLYGILRPYDGIFPYRLEMGYKLPQEEFFSLYEYWNSSIAECLPKNGPIVNLASVEYAKTITPFVDATRIFMPKFLTMNPKTNEPSFVVIHAKIARGAYARWLITQRIQDVQHLTDFHDLGYRFFKKLSRDDSPAFVCDVFVGKGLSMKKKLQ